MALRTERAPSSDLAAAAWLVDAPVGAEGTVGARIPARFEAYVRVLHPAYVIGEDRWVRWDEIARWSGQPLTRTADSKTLMVRDDGTSWDQLPGRNSPATGPLTFSPYLDRLASILRRHTTRPELVWGLYELGSYPFRDGDARTLYQAGSRGVGPLVARLSVWWGRFTAGGDGRSPDRYQVRVAGDRYALHRASLLPDDTNGAVETPNYWWPDDRAWLVYANVDCPTTYVAGPADLADELLTDPVLETVLAQLDDPFDGHG